MTQPHKDACCAACRFQDTAACQYLDCPCHQETPQTTYNHMSHEHCWNQGEEPACGQRLSDHKQCCLCDLVPFTGGKPPQTTFAEKKLVEFRENFPQMKPESGPFDGVRELFNEEYSKFESFLLTTIEDSKKEEQERIKTLAENIIQEERFSGTPYALNKLIAALNNPQEV